MKATAAFLAAVLLLAGEAPLFSQTAAVVHAAPGTVVAAPQLRTPVLSSSLILPTGGSRIETGGLPLMKVVVPLARTAAASGSSAWTAPAAADLHAAPAGVSAVVAAGVKAAASPRSSLESVETALAPARDEDAAPETRVTALQRAFAGARLYAEDLPETPAAVADAVVVSPALKDSATKEPSSLSAPPAPRRSLARAARYGFLMGLLSIAIKAAGFYGALALGFVPDPNYGSLVMDVAGAVRLSPLALMFHRAVYAPIWEELVFRCGLLGGLQKAGEWVHLPGAAVAASVLSSAVFVLLHEMADPLFIGLRMVEALLLSRTYLREGYAASVVQHATINGLQTAVNLALTVLAPGASTAVLAAVGLFTLAALAASLPSVLSQRGDRREGRIARHRLSPVVAVGLAVAFVAGTWLLIPYDLPKSLLVAMLVVYSVYNGWPLDV
ncbi:MAG: CPBP family intramembrane glutamic endopeptidase [Elusimicrobiota bacterium]